MRNSVNTHLSGDDSYFWHCGLRVGVQQFGSVSDDAAILLSGTWWESSPQIKGTSVHLDAKSLFTSLVGLSKHIWSTSNIIFQNTWQKTWNIHKSDDGNVEGVTEANETGSFYRGVDVQTT